MLAQLKKIFFFILLLWSCYQFQMGNIHYYYYYFKSGLYLFFVLSTFVSLFFQGDREI